MTALVAVLFVALALTIVYGVILAGEMKRLEARLKQAEEAAETSLRETRVFRDGLMEALDRTPTLTKSGMMPSGIEI